MISQDAEVSTVPGYVVKRRWPERAENADLPQSSCSLGKAGVGRTKTETPTPEKAHILETAEPSRRFGQEAASTSSGLVSQVLKNVASFLQATGILKGVQE